MNPHSHLEKRLKRSHEYLLSDVEKKTIQFEKVAKYIFNKVTSKKFRKTSINEEAREGVKKSIEINVSNNSPIKFTYPFGGYKIWRAPSYPEVDWGEFMTISYVIQYVAPILAAYEPGVEIYFSSDDVIIEQIDNYPREDLDMYVTSFNNLLNEFRKYLPNNLKVELKQVMPDIYSKKEYEGELEKLVNEYKKEGIPEDRKEKLKKAFVFNFQVKGKNDYSKLSKKDLEKVIEELMYPSDAYLKLAKRRDFVRGEDKIVLFSNPIPNAIDIGSTRVSKAKFWAGMGVLEYADGHFFDRILSPKQWEQEKESAKVEKVDLIPLKNFNEVSVFKNRLSFR